MYPHQSGARVQVLLVEDDDLVRDTLCEALHEAGLDAGQSVSAEAAMRLINAGATPRILVTDINLGGGMDGLAFGRAARGVLPGLPVVYISGRYEDVSGLSPAERFLAKPFGVTALLRAICDIWPTQDGTLTGWPVVTCKVP